MTAGQIRRGAIALAALGVKVARQRGRSVDPAARQSHHSRNLHDRPRRAAGCRCRHAERQLRARYAVRAQSRAAARRAIGAAQHRRGRAPHPDRHVLSGRALAHATERQKLIVAVIVSL